MHCTAGKDRTGVLVALVLALAGVEDEVIAKEYALTELGLAQWKEMIVGYLSQDLAMHGGREGAERMIGARYDGPGLSFLWFALLRIGSVSWGGVEKRMADNRDKGGEYDGHVTDDSEQVSRSGKLFEAAMRVQRWRYPDHPVEHLGKAELNLTGIRSSPFMGIL